MNEFFVYIEKRNITSDFYQSWVSKNLSVLGFSEKVQWYQDMYKPTRLKRGSSNIVDALHEVKFCLTLWTITGKEMYESKKRKS